MTPSSAGPAPGPADPATATATPATATPATATPATVDLVVVGGGIIGLTVAWRAARQGMVVALCDPAPGRGTSWVAAGMLAPVTEARAAEAPLVHLGLLSRRRWPSFADELATDAGCTIDDLGLCQAGTLQVAFDDDDRRALDELHQVHTILGLESEPCDARRCRQLEPLLGTAVRAGVLVPGDWQVDPRRVVDALRRALVGLGGHVVTTMAHRLLRREGAAGRVVGVELDTGTVMAARSVVLATGASQQALDGVPPGVWPPVHPVKGEILRLRADPGRLPLSLTVRGTVRGQPVYVVPRRHGEVVVGATMEEAGYDTSVRAASVLDLLRNATDLVPAIGELALVEAIAGLRPTTPDNGPVLGPTPVPGLHLAAGHFRHGVLLAPVTGDAVVGALATGALGGPAARFGLERFGSWVGHRA